jgi:hypothetical protein
MRKNKRKSKVRIEIRKDGLSKYGYKDIKRTSKKERHKALKRAIKEKKPLEVFRRLVAISTVNKNRDVELHDKIRDDAEWIKREMNK